jgi:hypothetical protein
MMHPLHDYIAQQVTEKLKSRRVVVWYDPRSEFVPFIEEMRGGASLQDIIVPVSLPGLPTQLAEYDGSFFALRAGVERHVSADLPEPLLIYLPGVERDRRGSVLTELEKAGTTWEPQLKQLGRNLLLKKYTVGVVDEILTYDSPVAYLDLARAASDGSRGEPPSRLKVIFQGVSGNDAVLAAWLASDASDDEIGVKGARSELVKLIRSRFGLELPDGAPLARLRAITLRYVLGGEFRINLGSAPAHGLDAVPSPKTKDEEAAVLEVAHRLRTAHAGVYPAIADRVEKELGLGGTEFADGGCGAAETFRFQEISLIARCAGLIAVQHFEEALTRIAEQEHGFWVDGNVERRAQWEACRRMAELGNTAVAVRAALSHAGSNPDDWIRAYTAKDGWCCLDQAQRRLEALVAKLSEEPDERALGVVRRLYEDVCHSMAEGFGNALARAGWTVSRPMQQTRIYSEVLTSRPKPVAYFLVDAMRFEMGVELAERLPTAAEISVQHAIASLPSITPIGMAALLPGASSSFRVAEQGGKLGACIDETFLPDLTSRRKFAAGRIPGLIDFSLDELLGLQPSRLAKKVEGSAVVIVRSQEIDHAGEAGFAFPARQVMDTVIDNLARAIRKLATAGIENAVVTADHGHLFFAAERDESMRTDAPGGDVVELHRRCWIGRGGSTPAGCIRASAAALGYASDLEFVFPTGISVFRAGGDLAYHHGGPSLQELLVPIVVVRSKAGDSKGRKVSMITASGLPDVVTNRIFTVDFQADLASGGLAVRPMLTSAGRQVGTAGMAVGAELDRTTGSVTLDPGKIVTVGFLLTDENVSSLRVVVLHAATDAELYRSPDDIPVRLGI